MMRIRCSNCDEIFEADQNQEWTVKKVIENRLLDVPLVCNLCGKSFIIDPQKIFNYKADAIKEQRKKRKASIVLGENRIRVVPQMDELFQTRKYQSSALSLMRVNDVVVSKTNTTSDFEYTLISVNDKYSEVAVKLIKSHLDYGIEALNKYHDVLKKINSPKDEIVLKLDSAGIPIAIVNKEEIQKSWEKVRNEIAGDKLFNEFNSEDRKKILAAADQEYYSLNEFSQIINKGFSLHALLFAGFCGEYQLRETKMLQPFRKQSLLFKDTEVPIEFEAKIKRFDSELLIAQVELQGIESDSFDFKKLGGLYKEAFPFAKHELETYKYDILANYEFDAFRGSIRTFNMTVLEEAGDAEMFMDCKIKILEDEESHFTE